MLIEKSVEVVTVKVSALFNPKDDQFPHFRLVPLEADRQGYLCLLFYIDRNNFLVWNPVSSDMRQLDGCRYYRKTRPTRFMKYRGNP